jgi:SPP1 gp7 family putative phage head morphogenesis protein
LQKPSPVNFDKFTAELDRGDLNVLASNTVDKVFKGQLKRGDIDEDLYKAFSEKLTEAVNTSYRVQNETLESNEILKKLQNNVNRFSAYKSAAVVDEMSNYKDEAETDEDYKRLAQGTANRHTGSYFDAELQITKARSRTAGQWQDIIANKDTLKWLRWETVGDEKVRKSHRALDGMTYPVDDKVWERYYPGFEYGCRCDWQSLKDGKIIEPQGDLPTPRKGLESNPGISGEIFTEKHSYFQVSKQVREGVEKFTIDNTPTENKAINPQWERGRKFETSYKYLEKEKDLVEYAKNSLDIDLKLGSEQNVQKANWVLEVITEAKKRGLELPSSIVFDKDEPYAAINPISKVMSIGTAKDLNTMIKHTKKLYKEADWATGDSTHIVFHEIGHLYQNQHKKPLSEIERVISNKVSNRAKQNIDEFCAEVFACLQLGRKLDDDVLSLYEDYSSYKIKDFK